ncbi:MAG: MmgE/PrpD family protein [Deltaproteobacteria bacterium]|nr:MmgE/PrpD family protein [Deltaproteobacteria bacterium]
MSASLKLAQVAARKKFQDLPPQVVHQTKRLVLDTLGCALGGLDSQACRIILEYVAEAGHPAQATVFGPGPRTSVSLAALANGTMVRYLDYNDTAFIIQGEIYRSGYHPSEVIPAILALAEWQGLSGREVITAINLGYDLSLAWLEGVIGRGIEADGWNGDTRGAYVMPLVLGRLLGLTPEEMVAAVGICGSCHAVFGILDTPAEEYTHTKNIRFPTMAQSAVQAVLLARRGFTGPAGMIDGHDGLIEVMMGGRYDLDRLLAVRDKNAILDSCIKSIIADYSSHGHLTATLNLVREHDIQPEEVDSIRITTSKRCAEHTGDPVKKYPRNKETADHSSYWLTAIAVLERQVGPNQFKPEKYVDPRAIELIDKVTLLGDPTLDKHRPAGISEITLKDGRIFKTRVDHPRGHAKNPMTDQEVVDKFRDMADRHMSRDRLDRLIETVMDLDRLAHVGRLMELMALPRG